MVDTKHLQTIQTLNDNGNISVQNLPLRLRAKEFLSLFECLHILPIYQVITLLYFPVLSVGIIYLGDMALSFHSLQLIWLSMPMPLPSLCIWRCGVGENTEWTQSCFPDEYRETWKQHTSPPGGLFADTLFPECRAWTEIRQSATWGWSPLLSSLGALRQIIQLCDWFASK